MSQIDFEKLLKDCSDCRAKIKMSDVKETLEECLATLYQQHSDVKNIAQVMGKDTVTGLLSGILFSFLTSLYVFHVLKDKDKIEAYLQDLDIIEKPDKYIN